MCGINAIYAYRDSAPAVDREELVATRECMRSRGPDAASMWISADARVGLGHRRLAIIDLSPGGAQPMCRASASLGAGAENAIVFNGEIYNYRELRRGLEGRGVRFTSQSDTEVLLQLYATRGAEMLAELRGMFAFALWDSEKRRMFLARDPYGIKPLYFADDGATVRVASQVRALIASGRVSKQFDSAGAVGFFLRGTVPEPFTMYRAIRAVPAGSYCFIDANGVSEPVRYFSIAKTLRDALDRDQAVDVHDALVESVQYHMVSDVPVGAFLSAGIDSTSIVALARESGATDLQTMTLRFDEYRGRVNDEAPIAAEVAKQYGVQHTIRDLTREEFLRELPRVFDVMDQPSVDGLNSYFISKAAHDIGLKVALSGTGGDELFGGYTSFRDIPRWIPFSRTLGRVPGVRSGVAKANAFLAKRSRHVSPKMSEIVRYGSSYAGAYLVKRGRFLASELPSLVGREVARDGLERLDLLHRIEEAITPDPGTPYARIVALESSFYLRNQLLRDMDWASMAHSLEVRVPLVDAHLLRRLAPLLVHRKGRGKDILAAAPRPPLPPTVVDRRKTGFTLPIQQWLGGAEHGKRAWARRVYATMYASDRGRW
ncbi:MAG TPA: asparagine synthase (glutamine-hydrolyzing) [Thermoanaerobaculia bacterium]|nr:asparagine synthase (glutamine-hydrolyzing) [Thermoanaerobaculia bacterium]